MKATRILGLLLLATTWGAAATCPQENPPLSQDTVLTFVHDLLQVFYPELIVKGNRLRLCVNHPADSSWREISGVYFTVLPDPPYDGIRKALGGNSVPAKDVVSSNTMLLNGLVWLPPLEHGSRIQELDISPGSMVTQKYDAFVEFIRLHPEWENEDFVKRLSSDGARFGADKIEGLLDSVRWRNAEKFLGKLKVTRSFFKLPNEERIGSFEAGAMEWTVYADAHFQDGTDGQYAFVFEPFEGKLIHLLRIKAQ